MSESVVPVTPGYPPGYDPEFLTPEEAILLKGTTPGVDMSGYAARETGRQRWVIDGLIPAGGTTAIYGPPKRARKSYMAIQMARDIAEGVPFLGQFKVEEQATVLFLQLDTPQSIWQERYEKLEASGVPFPPEVKSRLITADTTDIFPMDINSPKGQAFVKYHVRKYNPSVVVFDVLRKFFKGSEDDNDVIEQTLASMKAACAPAAVLFITHAKKPSREPGRDTGTMNELRGSSHIGGSCDTVLRIKPPNSKRKFTVLSVEGRAVATVDYPLKSLDNRFYEAMNDDDHNALDRFTQKLIDGEFKNPAETARAIMEHLGKDAKDIKEYDRLRMAVSRHKAALADQ